MKKIEKVKTILSVAEYVEESETGNKCVSAALSISQVKDIAQQINQLYEPQSDQPRLLTDDDNEFPPKKVTRIKYVTEAECQARVRAERKAIYKEFSKKWNGVIVNDTVELFPFPYGWFANLKEGKAIHKE